MYNKERNRIKGGRVRSGRRNKKRKKRLKKRKKQMMVNSIRRGKSGE